MTFAKRLTAGISIVLLVTIIILVWFAERSLRRDLERDIAAALAREARLVRQAIPPDSLRWQDAVRQLSTADGHRITLIDDTGRVRADSDFPPGPLPPIENHRNRAEVREALAGRTGVAVRRSETVGRALMYVAVPGGSGEPGEGTGVVRVAASLAQVDATVRAAQRAVLGAAALALLVGLGLALATSASIAQPLTAIGSAARAIAAGSPPRFPHSGVPDIDALVNALRQMHRQLGERFDELRQEQAESAALVAAMTEGVIAADGRGRVITLNPAARQLLGYAPHESVPDLPELFRAKAARDIVDAVMTGVSIQSRELELDGRDLVVSACPLPAGGAVLVLHDLTEVRRLELVRRDFVDNVSHEFKTPLTSISGYTETLLDDRPDAETTRRFLEIILSNARRLQRMVDGLLDLARIEAGRWQPKPERVDLGPVAREVWASVAGCENVRQVSFDIDLDADAPTVTADPDALRQVLTNVIDNALRYTPPGGAIVCRAQVEGDGVRLGLSDTGAGIGREHLSRIFERFYRGDLSRSRGEGGTGLGLAIVKHLVEAHGGWVAADSELGVGTTVSCWFPNVAAAGVSR